MSALGRYGESVVLVLDDVHTLTEHDCLASIDYALLHVPENVRVIACTRIDPALGLPRLRAAQELTELRASDLAFTSSEAHALLWIDSGSTSADQIDVWSGARGWPRRWSSRDLAATVEQSEAVSHFGGASAVADT
jgi:LuxR family maltose regulon positive regulatory protein